MRKPNALSRNMSIVFILNMLVSAINYLGQLFMGRFLSVESFGTLNAIFSFLPIAAVPAAALTTTITKRVAEQKGEGTRATASISLYLSKVSWALIALGAAVALASLLAYRPLQQTLGIASGAVLLGGILLVVTSYYPALYQGGLAGLHRFLPLGLIALVSPAMKMAAAALSSLFPGQDYFQQAFILFAIDIGNLVSIGLGLWMLHRAGVRLQARGLRAPGSRVRIPAELLWIGLTNLGLMLLMNVDILALRLFTGPEAAGQYSSVQLFARIVYYLATSLTTVMLPMMASAHSARQKSIHLYFRSLLYVTLFSLAFLLPLNLFSPQLLGLFFGSKFNAALPYVKYASLIAFALSLNTVTANYLIGAGRIKAATVIMLSGGLATALLSPVVPPSPHVVLFVIGITSLLVFVGGLCIACCGQTRTIDGGQTQHKHLLGNVFLRHFYLYTILKPHCFYLLESLRLAISDKFCYTKPHSVPHFHNV